jgi:hypothetical protein
MADRNDLIQVATACIDLRAQQEKYSAAELIYELGINQIRRDIESAFDSIEAKHKTMLEGEIRAIDSGRNVTNHTTRGEASTVALQAILPQSLTQRLTTGLNLHTLASATSLDNLSGRAVLGIEIPDVEIGKEPSIVALSDVLPETSNRSKAAINLEIVLPMV